MLFSYQEYKHISINIFDYADMFDFLIAPFADSKIILFSSFTFALCYLVCILHQNIYKNSKDFIQNLIFI